MAEESRRCAGGIQVKYETVFLVIVAVALVCALAWNGVQSENKYNELRSQHITTQQELDSLRAQLGQARYIIQSSERSLGLIDSLNTANVRYISDLKIIFGQIRLITDQLIDDNKKLRDILQQGENGNGE